MKTKSIFLLFFLLYHSITFSQSVNTSAATAINNVFGPLEKNRVPYNILLDYGIELTDISKYNGVLNTDNYVDIGVYKDTYNTLVSSCTATGVSGINSPLTEENEWETLQQQKTVASASTGTVALVLSGLYYNYSRFRADALSTNKISIVNGKYDDKYINGVWQNPYESKIAFAFSAPVLELNKATVEVSLPATLWQTNATISNIHIDFGNGTGYKSLNSNTTASTTYLTTGTFTWTYRIQLSNGQYNYCRQKILVNASSGAQQRLSGCPIDDTVTVNATRAYLGVAGSAKLQIAYADVCGQIKKPLIVVEGLDTGLLAASGVIGDSDIRLFLDKVDKSESTALKNLITNNTTIDYDIIYVNWNNGTDYLQRNAYVLEEVIKWVNANKTTTTPNVILGQSMGGVIARYALRDMENLPNENHDTSLYISHDAPHQGANVPLGFLYMARHLLDQQYRTPLGNEDLPISSGSISQSSIKNLLDAPAVRQLLIRNVNSSFAVDYSLRTSWETELKNMGYPQQTRNIALSNASHCASPQGVTAGQRIFELDAYGKSSFFTDVVLSMIPIGDFAGQIANRLFDAPGLLLNALPGNSKFDIDFWVNAYPSSGTSQIYHGKVGFTKTLLWLLPINTTITERNYNSPSGSLPQETYPGGVNPTFTNLDVNAAESNLLFKYDFDVSLNPDFNFVSAVSALDVGSNNVQLTNSDYLATYTKASPPTGSKAIPFDNFTTSYNTSSINEPHITFNARNGNWLAKELDANPNNQQTFDCSFLCASSVTISGATSICSSGNSFTVNNLPVGATIFWSNSSNLTRNSTQGANPCTFSAIGSGNGWVKATINSINCDTPLIIQKNVEVGVSASNIIIWNDTQTSYPYNTIPTNTPVAFVAGYPPNDRCDILDTQWQVSASSTIFGGNVPCISNNNTSKNIIFHNTGTAYVKAKVKTSCGWSGWSQAVAIDVTSGSYMYSVYPNPASNEVYVTESKSSVSKNSEAIEIEIYDFTGNIVGQTNYKAGEVERKVNVSNLKKGNYFLRIIGIKEDEIHRIIVE